MEKINAASKIKFEGIKKMPKIEMNFEDKIQKMVKDLSVRAEREVPEYGDFKMVYEEFPNPEKNICATDFMLKIYKPDTKNSEKIRNLEAVAYNIPHPYKAERVIINGTKEEVLNILKSKDLPQKLKRIFIDLAQHLAQE